MGQGAPEPHHHRTLRLRKSFLASALGQQACIYGYRVLYWSASKLFAHLKLSKADGRYLRELGKIARRDAAGVTHRRLRADCS